MDESLEESDKVHAERTKEIEELKAKLEKNDLEAKNLLQKEREFSTKNATSGKRSLSTRPFQTIKNKSMLYSKAVYPRYGKKQRGTVSSGLSKSKSQSSTKPKGDRK